MIRRAGPAALALAACALSACIPVASAPVSDPGAYAPSPAPVPPAVTALLPRGLTAADVVLAQNCYGYRWQGQIYPVLNPRGSQYCI